MTPVLAWDPVPGATSYRVYVAQDANFTGECPMGGTATPVASNDRELTNWSAAHARPTCRPRHCPRARRRAYYWYVAACETPSECDPPRVAFRPVPGTEAFRKASPGRAAG